MSASRDSGYSDNGAFSIGLTYLRNLADGKYIRFLMYVGSNAFIEYEKPKKADVLPLPDLNKQHLHFIYPNIW
jgi:hypothetical protein